MAGDDRGDPFLWDEDQVVQELCTPNRSWKAPPARKLPDAAALEAKLRDCGVDGETLLTYADEFDFPSLWAYLGVKKLPHQLSLKDAISHFRKTSTKYREWKAQQVADSQPLDDEDDGPIKSETPKPSGLELPAQLAPVAEATPSNESGCGSGDQPAPAQPESAIPSHGVLSPALSTSAGHVFPVPLGSVAREHLGPGQEVVNGSLESEAQQEPGPEQVVEGPPNKKRKIAPIALSTEPLHTTASHIPTEGDMFLTALPHDFPQEVDSSAFLGAALRVDKLPDPDSVSETEFSWVRNPFPRGRRIQVSATMKRFFRSHRVDRITDEEEEPLPVFGESDDESIDSETWREYEKEEAERQAMKAQAEAAKKRNLTKEQVEEAVHNVIQELESQWLAEKKPKWDRKAWKIWQDARRNPDRLAYINWIKELAKKIDTRIARMTAEILKCDWPLDEDIQRKASAHLELSVFEKRYRAWQIDILESPRPPPKPSALPRPAPRPAKPKVLDDGDGEELLSSDSDIDDFIEYDDIPAPFFNDEMEIDSDPPPAEAIAPASPDTITPAPVSPAPDDSPAPGEEVEHHLPAARSTPSSEEDDNCLPPMWPTPKKIKSEEKLAPQTPRRISTSAPEVIEIESSPSPVKELYEAPGLDDLESLERIGEIGVEYWEGIPDAERLVVAVLCEWSLTKRSKLSDAVNNCDHDEIWAKYMWPTIEDPGSAKRVSVEIDLARLFDVFISKTARRVSASTLRSITCQRMKRCQPAFEGFCAYLKRILPIFLSDTVPSRPPTRIVIKTPSPPKKPPIPEIRDPAEDPGSSSNSDESSSEEVPVPSTKKRRRPKRLDKNAKDLRISNLKLNEELERRRSQLREKLAEEGSVPSDKSRLIVNETKESDEQGLIYINDRIGRRIKDHQIDGVRFMWNQVVVDSKVRQGCLLAHTMGLGKTMQVITLLVVIAEASASPDPAIHLQIPKRLRKSKTLILCPPGLVDNWYEEIMIWADGDVLGPVRKMEAALQNGVRVQLIRDWAASGGILIIGYAMFAAFVRDDKETAKLLHETPNLVIGDEAHMMKNPNSQRHQATANFKTMNRIAMTGSPLTNNVMDYYAMINWVAPNYLADIAEFRERFSKPIKEGLYADSEPHQKRTARKRLQVLKKTVDPKVHRKDIQVLFNELPQKKEFIITLPLTKLQKRLYETYIDWVANPGIGELMTGQARVWDLVAKLGLVLAHPIIFKTVAEEQKAKPTKGGALQISKAAQAAKNAESDDDRFDLPQDVLIKLLATVAVREIEDYALSNKILVLLRILDECKKVGDKVLVFSQSIPTLDYLENIFKRQRVAYQRLDGKTPMPERQTSVKKFNTDSISEVYLISTRAGGVGLNIYGANRVIIFDFKYTPADEQQAIGRAYRLGQTKPVYVYWLTVGGTFEETIHNNAIFKTQLASRVVDKKNPAPWSKRFGEYFVMPRIPNKEDLSKAYGQDRVLDALLKSDDIGKLMCKITSTETFEKEETYEFSPEDQREMEQDIELEQLRISNPDEYRRREHARIWQSRTELGMPPPPLGQSQLPSSANGEFSSTSVPFTGNQNNTMVKIKVPEHLREKRDPGPPAPTVDGIAPTTLLPSAQQNNKPPKAPTLTPDSALANPPTQPPFPIPPPLFPSQTANFAAPTLTQSPAGQGNAASGNVATGETVTSTASPTQGDLNNAPTQEAPPNLQPILGAGTHYKTLSESSPPAPPAPPAPLAPSTPSAPQVGSPLMGTPNTPSFIAAPNPNFDLTNLTGLHKRLSQAGQRVRYSPSDLINKVEEVLVERKTERLPLMDKLQNLQKCTREPRFAEALLAGHIEPEQLASMTRSEMEEMTTSLNGMAEADFKQRVWTTKADISQMRAQLSTKIKTERRRTTDGSGETSGAQQNRGSRGALLRFIGAGPRTPAPTTPPPRDGGLQPGDSAESPQIID